MGLFSRKKTNIEVEVKEIRQAPSMSVRQSVGRRRTFQGAETPSIVSSWTSTPQAPDQIVMQQLTTLRARSRQLVDSTDYAPQFIRLCETNIVGDTGFRFCAKSRDANGELDTKANEALEAAWKTWGEAEHCDFDQKLNDAAFDRLLLRTVAIDGEAFVHELPGDLYGVSYRLIDPELIPVSLNRDRGTSVNLIRFGIEYDRYDRPVAYYVMDQAGKVQYGGKTYTRISAELITHVFIKTKVGQRRGFPWMSASIFRMKMIGKFEDSALQNAVVGASKVGIVSGENADEVVDAIDEEGGRIMDTEHVGLYVANGEVNLDTFDTAFPSSEYGTFMKANVRSLAAGFGVNYNVLASDLEGVSYSGLKHGSTTEIEFWKVAQDWFMTDWKKKQYRRWLRFALLKGIEKKPIRLRPENYDKYAAFEFRGRRWKGPDPLKDVSAQAGQVDMGIKSLRMIIMENGDDPDEVFEQRAQEIELFKQMGIPVKVPNHRLDDVLAGAADDDD